MNDMIIWEEKNLIEPKMKLENNGINVQNVIIPEIRNQSSKNVCEGIGKIKGIYKIINKVNGKYYVGSSNDIKKRWIHHRTLLNHNKHDNKYLQNAWNKYGKENFDFLIIEKDIDEDKLLLVEQRYIDLCKQDRDESYNLTLYSTSPMKGRKMSESTKLKMSESHKNYIFTEEHKQNLSKSKTGINHHFYGKRPPNFGKKMSEEQRKKLSDIKKGKTSPMKGKKFSVESKLKMSISAKKRWELKKILSLQINNIN